MKLERDSVTKQLRDLESRMSVVDVKMEKMVEAIRRSIVYRHNIFILRVFLVTRSMCVAQDYLSYLSCSIYIVTSIKSMI
jgi:hypothetical protein